MAQAAFLLPVRDAETTLAAAIESAVAQTRPAAAIVVIDDGSEDASASIAEQLAEQHPRIRVVRQGRLGLVPALNRGLREISQPLVARLDADDIAHPDRLALQLPMLDADPHLTVVDSQVRIRRPGDQPPAEGMRRWQHWIGTVLSPEDFDRNLLIESPVVHPAATFRRDAVLDIGGYRDGPFPEDYDLWLRLHAAGARFRKVAAELHTMVDRPDRLTRVDPRYGRDGFRRVRQQWLGSTVLSTPKRVLLWGAGKSGRPWLRWLLQQGCTVPAVVDIDPKKIGNIRQGHVPIVAPDEVPEITADIGLVAVAAWGARQDVRTSLHRLRPGWIEGRDWWAVC